MEQHKYIDFLPVGSVVIVKGNIRKMVIVARGVMARVEGKVIYFDYAGVLYPEGMTNDKLIYFNNRDLSRIVFVGYSDEDEMLMKENINEWIEQSGIQKGNPYDINRKNAEKNL